MSTHFLPTREGDLVTWSANFKAKLQAGAASYGVTPAQATAYGARHDFFVAAHQTANNPDTRSPSNIVAKDLAKYALEADARMLARIIQATPTVTPEQKAELGLTVRDARPTPIPPPGLAPTLDVKSVSGTTVRIRLHDAQNPTRRGRPLGIAGASVFSFVGTTPPADLSDWKFEGSTTRTRVDVLFPADTAPGAKVWLCAFWFNPRSQRGPACAPVGTNVPGGGGVSQAA